jgi:glycerol kinase
MPTDAILAIDQGTTNTKAVLVNRTGEAVFRSSTPVKLLYPSSNLVEQDPQELWQSVLSVIHACTDHAKHNQLHIAGIAISNQRETAVAWRPGATPQALANAISWQCRRSSEICNRLAPHAEQIESIAGLPIDPLNSAGKWAWLLEQHPALRNELLRGDALLGNIDAWLLANLTGGQHHATDDTNASRTGLYSLQQAEWSAQLLDLYGLPANSLPAIQQSSSHFGLCTSVPELNGVPVVAMIGDSHAALIGHGSFTPGAAKATYGTGSSLMMLTSGLPGPTQTLARTVAWSDAQGIRFALEGNIAMTGSAVQWVGEFLGLKNPTEAAIVLAASVADAQGLRFVPAMVGLGAPHWDTDARGLIANLGRSHTAAHLARAAVDAIAFQVADVVACLEQASGTRIPSLRVDGGATRNDALMRLQADLIDRPVLRSTNEELSAIGAAWLGGLTLGWWSSTADLERLPHPAARFDPAMDPQVRGELHDSWQLAIQRTCLKPGETLP